MRRILSTLILFLVTPSLILGDLVGFSFAYASSMAPTTPMHLSATIHPPVLRGVQINLNNPFQFNFMIDQADGSELDKNEASKLIKYFLSGIAISQEDIWVNLSPLEENRIMPEAMAQTVIGKELLDQDYLLKQLTSSLTHPDTELGKTYWDTLYKAIYDATGGTDVPSDTLHKVWITPDYAKVYANGDHAYISDLRLKVQMQEDYWKRKAREEGRKTNSSNTPHLTSYGDSSFVTESMRSIILPALENEINHGSSFAPLRQVFHSIILAMWFKKHLKNHLVHHMYADQNKTVGVNHDVANIREKTYEQYLAAYKKGAYNYIKEEYDSNLEETVPRKYFSGGAYVGAYEDVVKEQAGFDTAMFAGRGHSVGVRLFSNVKRLTLLSTLLAFLSVPSVGEAGWFKNVFGKKDVGDAPRGVPNMIEESKFEHIPQMKMIEASKSRYMVLNLEKSKTAEELTAETVDNRQLTIDRQETQDARQQTVEDEESVIGDGELVIDDSESQTENENTVIGNRELVIDDGESQIENLESRIENREELNEDEKSEVKIGITLDNFKSQRLESNVLSLESSISLSSGVVSGELTLGNEAFEIFTPKVKRNPFLPKDELGDMVLRVTNPEFVIPDFDPESKISNVSSLESNVLQDFKAQRPSLAVDNRPSTADRQQTTDNRQQTVDNESLAVENTVIPDYDPESNQSTVSNDLVIEDSSSDFIGPLPEPELASYKAKRRESNTNKVVETEETIALQGVVESSLDIINNNFLQEARKLKLPETLATKPRDPQDLITPDEDGLHDLLDPQVRQEAIEAFSELPISEWGSVIAQDEDLAFALIGILGLITFPFLYRSFKGAQRQDFIIKARDLLVLYKELKKLNAEFDESSIEPLKEGLREKYIRLSHQFARQHNFLLQRKSDAHKLRRKISSKALKEFEEIAKLSRKVRKEFFVGRNGSFEKEADVLNFQIVESEHYMVELANRVNALSRQISLEEIATDAAMRSIPWKQIWSVMSHPITPSKWRRTQTKFLTNAKELIDQLTILQERDKSLRELIIPSITQELEFLMDPKDEGLGKDEERLAYALSFIYFEYGLAREVIEVSRNIRQAVTMTQMELAYKHYQRFQWKLAEIHQEEKLIDRDINERMKVNEEFVSLEYQDVKGLVYTVKDKSGNIEELSFRDALDKKEELQQQREQITQEFEETFNNIFKNIKLSKNIRLRIVGDRVISKSVRDEIMGRLEDTYQKVQDQRQVARNILAKYGKGDVIIENDIMPLVHDAFYLNNSGEYLEGALLAWKRLNGLISKRAMALHANHLYGEKRSIAARHVLDVWTKEFEDLKGSVFIGDVNKDDPLARNSIAIRRLRSLLERDINPNPDRPGIIASLLMSFGPRYKEFFEEKNFYALLEQWKLVKEFEKEYLDEDVDPKLDRESKSIEQIAREEGGEKLVQEMDYQLGRIKVQNDEHKISFKEGDMHAQAYLAAREVLFGDDSKIKVTDSELLPLIKKNIVRQRSSALKGEEDFLELNRISLRFAKEDLLKDRQAPKKKNKVKPREPMEFYKGKTRTVSEIAAMKEAEEKRRGGQDRAMASNQRLEVSVQSPVDNGIANNWSQVTGRRSLQHGGIDLNFATESDLQIISNAFQTDPAMVAPVLNLDNFTGFSFTVTHFAPILNMSKAMHDWANLPVRDEIALKE